MAKTITQNNTESISLNEFFELCDQIKLESEEELEAYAPYIKMLANNPKCISDYLCEYLTSMSSLEQEHSFLPPVFMPKVTDNYIFRIVIWPVIQISQDKNGLLYNYAHNHDVGFLTCGYCGSGYRTDIYDYDYQHHQGLVNEPVELDFLESTTLPPGKIMQYMAGSDMHMQYAPETPSISLNMIKREKQKKIVECSFDMDESKIVGHSIKTVGHESIFWSACMFGDGNCLDVIEHIAKTHPFMRVRAAAWQALIENNQKEMESYTRLANMDKHEHVRAYVNKVNENLVYRNAKANS